jgi:DNA-binding CsgD family transcriptional regulator/putative methionine-R-sulfoxide reductase with GAF domain
MAATDIDAVCLTDLDERLSALGSRLRVLLASRPSDDAARALFDELAELALWVVEASANRLVDTAQARQLMETATALQSELRGAMVEAHARTFGQINEALATLAGSVSPAELVRRAPRLLCEACGFDRAMISRVRGSTWVPAAVYVAAGTEDEVNLALVEAIRRLEIPLTSSLIETELLRRRRSMLVDGTTVDRHTFGQLATLSHSRAYVAAPIVIGDRVAGFLHADAYSSARMLTQADRVALQTFADMFGLLYERAAMGDRLRTEQQAIRAALSSAADSVADAELTFGALVRAETPRSEVAAHRDEPLGGGRRDGSCLTSREWEILGLLATGATNGQIAAALVVSESTVKSHVKRILHKLPAANRAEAVYRYTQVSSKRTRAS